MQSVVTSESPTPAPSRRDETHAGVPRLGRTAYRASSDRADNKDLPAFPSSPPIDPESAIKFLIERLSLTRRQAEVLHWIAEGKTNEEISLILDLSFHTVKNHVSQLFQRLGAPGRTAAACAYRAHVTQGHKTQPWEVKMPRPRASPRQASH